MPKYDDEENSEGYLASVESSVPPVQKTHTPIHVPRVPHQIAPMVLRLLGKSCT